MSEQKKILTPEQVAEILQWFHDWGCVPGFKVVQLCGTINALRAERDAALRLLAGKYVTWDRAGGPNECDHGYAAGIPCPCCDRKRVENARLLSGHGSES